MANTPNDLNFSNTKEVVNDGEDLNIKLILLTLLRKKKFFIRSFIFIQIITLIYAITRKPLWEGQFQIVLSDNSSNFSKAKTAALAETNPAIGNLIGSSSEQKLNTEVKILESPSILKPAFEIVKEYKKKNGKSVEKFNFLDWKEESLKVDLIRKTSVLDIRYRDNSKELIRKVIEKISKDYQLYSGRDREKGLNNGLLYLKEQVNLYTTKSANSIRKAQKYAIEQDLYPLKEENSEGVDQEVTSSIDIERIRVEAANKLRNIDYQLKQLSQLGNDPNKIMYYGKLIPEVNAQGLPKLLDDIDTKLALYKSQFKDNDEIITKLLKNRDIYIKTLKNQAEGYLKALKIDTEARLSSTVRPKGVLIKYKSLLREATRDKLFLNQLENDKQLLALEKARSEDPWQLITEPTISEDKVYPNKIKIVFLGFIFGTFISSILTLLDDKRKGKIFYYEEIINLLPYKFLLDLKVDKDKQFLDLLTLLKSSQALNDESGTKYLYNPGERNSKLEQQILSTINDKNQEIKLLSKLSEVKRNENLIILFIGGEINYSTVNYLIRSISLINVNVIGWIFVNS